MHIQCDPVSHQQPAQPAGSSCTTVCWRGGAVDIHATLPVGNAGTQRCVHVALQQQHLISLGGAPPLLQLHCLPLGQVLPLRLPLAGIASRLLAATNRGSKQGGKRSVLCLLLLLLLRLLLFLLLPGGRGRRKQRSKGAMQLRHLLRRPSRTASSCSPWLLYFRLLLLLFFLCLCFDLLLHFLLLLCVWLRLAPLLLLLLACLAADLAQLLLDPPLLLPDHPCGVQQVPQGSGQLQAVPHRCRHLRQQSVFWVSTSSCCLLLVALQQVKRRLLQLLQHCGCQGRHKTQVRCPTRRLPILCYGRCMPLGVQAQQGCNLPHAAGRRALLQHLLLTLAAAAAAKCLLYGAAAKRLHLLRQASCHCRGRL